jgi:DNA polymerase-1
MQDIAQTGRKKLFLLDNMALIFRAYYSFINNPRITTKGDNTSALYGYLLTLFDIINNQKPTHLAVCTDVGSKTFRHSTFPEYKAGRQETPEDIVKAIPMISKLLDAMNIPLIGLENYEADDLVGTLAIRAQADGFDVYMMTPDKDFAQLVDEHIWHYKPAKPPKPAEVLGVRETLDKWEIDRIEQVIDVLGLMGDKVDNIPGIPGIGERTAIKLVQEFGSVENLLANSGRLKGKQKEAVERYGEQALLSKQLATIDIHSPVAYEPGSYELRDYKTGVLKELLEQYEIRTLGTRIFGDGYRAGSDRPPAQVGNQLSLFGGQEGETVAGTAYLGLADVPHDYRLVSSVADLRDLVDALKGETEISFDTETSSLDTLTCELVGMSFSNKKGMGWYVAMDESHEDWREKLDLVRPLLEDEHKALVGQNIKFDMAVMRQKGVELKGKLWDTMLAHYVIEPDGKHGMDAMSEAYLGYSPVKIETLIGSKKGPRQGSMKDLKPEEICDYAAEDADVTLQLKEVLAPKLQEVNGGKVFHDIECPLVEVLCHMEMEGIRVDTEFLAGYSVALREQMLGSQARVFEEAGMEFNLNSPKQLGEVLFERMKLDAKAKKTKTGQYKTDEATLEKLGQAHPIVGHILDYRELAKLKSTYVDALPQLVHPKTGRVHTTYQQAVAATGRLSSNDPNLQNIPIRTAKGREVRRAFVPRNDDYRILSADYSQVELRIVASISGDSALIEAFRMGADIHTATAARIYGVSIEEVDLQQRANAKAVNFGIIYGQGAFGLAENLGISRTEAKEIIDQYFDRYPGLKRYMADTVAKARDCGYVETLTGRRRYLRDINSANFTVRGFAERNAINSPIQGTAADLIKIAMIRVHKAMRQAGMRSKLLLQVHDELVFDAHVEEVPALEGMVKELMAGAMELQVPLVAEAGVGMNWLEAH